MDVNDAFARERETQVAAAAASVAAFDRRIAAGEIEPTPGRPGMYTVKVGWDRGEILALDRATGMVMPQHGLDLNADGTAQLYSAVPTWHQLGNIIPGGISDIDQVLYLSGLDFEVTKEPAYHLYNGELERIPDTWSARHSRTGVSLGSVGEVYKHVQNREAYQFIESLLDEGSLICESGGSMRGGTRTFLSFRLPEPVIIDEGGIDDIVVPFIAGMNSHNGTTKFTVVVTPWRPVCGNTERLAIENAVYKWTTRHTTHALGKLADARETLLKSTQYYAKFAEIETALARTPMSADQFEAFLAEVYPPDEEAGKQAQRNEADRANRIREIFGLEGALVGATAYAAERAVTGYVDHDRKVGELKRVSGLSAARATLNYEGTEDATKHRAHRALLTLANR